MSEPSPDAIEDQIKALRERLDLIWSQHEREHKAHEAAHSREHEQNQKAIDTAAALAKENKADANEWRGTMTDRERTFATKSDITNIADKITNLERADIKRTERESDAERRVARSQWTIALVVGTFATVGAVLVNAVLRLSSS